MSSEPPTRTSRLDPSIRLLYADLHNHSLMSDGLGDPESAFQLMRAAGLDVAALTDHASIPHHALDALDLAHYPHREALAIARTAPASLDADEWRRTAELADAADEPGQFTAIRGFEWTEPWLGHANVWFSGDYLGVTTPGRLHGLQDWLRDHEPDALFGYNHPGRERGRFHDFEPLDHLRSRMVGLEAFNRREDMVLSQYEDDRGNPVVACLDAGWRPGLTGVSDEHGVDYGIVGKGRTGLWATEHSRAGVRAALLSRRTYATREPGLLLDATLNGVPMGGTVERLAGASAVDLDAADDLRGRDVELQLLTSGPMTSLRLVATSPATVGELAHIEVTNAAAGWLLLRVADLSRPAGPAYLGQTAVQGRALAYSSPWYVQAREGRVFPIWGPGNQPSRLAGHGPGRIRKGDSR